MSGRFVDVTATERLVLPCSCPQGPDRLGTPHDEDYVLLRTELGGPEWQEVGRGTLQALGVLITEWNFTDAEGKPVPITFDTLRAMDTPTFVAIDRWIDTHLEFPKLPNASGAPSRNGTGAERGHRTRTTQTKS